MRCDGSPDPSISGEINTFLTLWKEDAVNDIKSSLKHTELALEVANSIFYTPHLLKFNFLNLLTKLIDELSFLIHDMPEDQFSEKLINQYKEVGGIFRNDIIYFLKAVKTTKIKCHKIFVRLSNRWRMRRWPK